jgi:hypothetical protein
VLVHLRSEVVMCETPYRYHTQTDGETNARMLETPHLPHTHIHTHTSIHTHTHTHTCLKMHTHTHTYMPIYTLDMLSYSHTCLHTHTCVHIHIHVFSYTHVPTHTCLHTLYTHTVFYNSSQTHVFVRSVLTCTLTLLLTHTTNNQVYASLHPLAERANSSAYQMGHH